MTGVVGLTTYHILHLIYFFLNRKWQEANQKIQELQAGQDAREDQEQRIKVSCFVSVPGLCVVSMTGVVSALLPSVGCF